METAEADSNLKFTGLSHDALCTHHWSIVMDLAWDTMKDIARKVLPDVLKDKPQFVVPRTRVEAKYVNEEEEFDYINYFHLGGGRHTRKQMLDEFQEQAETVIMNELKLIRYLIANLILFLT